MLNSESQGQLIEAAVGDTLECESYLVRPTLSGAVVAPVQMESKDIL